MFKKVMAQFDQELDSKSDDQTSSQLSRGWISARDDEIFSALLYQKEKFLIIIT